MEKTQNTSAAKGNQTKQSDFLGRMCAQMSRIVLKSRGKTINADTVDIRDERLSRNLRERENTRKNQADKQSR